MVQGVATGTGDTAGALATLEEDDLPARSLGAAAVGEAATVLPAGGAVSQVADAVVALAESTGNEVHAEVHVERTEVDLIMEARVKGYEGEACGECGNFTLVRNGTCLKCDTCGGTSGCS